MPKEIGQLKKLNILEIQENELTSLPDEMEDLESLDLLYIRRDQLSLLPEKVIAIVEKNGGEIVLTDD